jgi:two-component system, cell cycle sensor histidine kinase and response regulator CckA
VGAIIYRADGRCETANEAAARILGYSTDQIRRHELGSVGAFVDSTVVDRARETLVHGSPFEGRVAARTDAGVDLVLDVRLGRMQIAGAPALLVIFADVTEQQRAEDALRLTQLSVDHAADLIHWIAPDGHLLYVSDSTCRRQGYSRDELLNMTIFDLDPTMSGDTWARHWRDLEAHGAVTIETVHVTKDGTVFPVEVTANLIEHGGERYNFAFARDISARLEMERSLRLTQYSVDRAADYVYWIDSRGAYVYVNESACRRLGYSRDELLRMTVFDVDPTAPVPWEAHVAEVQAQGSSTFETLHRTKGGDLFPVEVTSTHVEFDGQEFIFGFCRDITERRRPETELREREEQLRRSQRIETVGRLAGGIAHDFNNLLTAVRGYADLVLAAVPSGTVDEGDVKEIIKAADRAAALTSQLLAFSRRHPLQTRVLSVNQVVGGLLSLLGRLLGEHIEIQVILAPDLGAVEADGGQLEQVIVNLAVNARDAMTAGGRLLIETADVLLPTERMPPVPEAPPGSYVMLAVTDTGTGMDKGTLAQVFEPFFTTKEPGQGTGLGLSMVYGITTQMGGYVVVESAVGAGSTFRILLPRVAGRASDLPEAGTVADVGHPAVEATILFVEDEPAIAALAERVLQKRGYRVLTAGSAEEAVRVASGFAGTIDLLVTDVVLPGADGTQIAGLLAAQGRGGCRVLFISGYSRDALAPDGRIDSAVAFLEKPFSPVQLVQKVAEVLAS